MAHASSLPRTWSVAIAALFLGACSDRSPTEPPLRPSSPSANATGAFAAQESAGYAPGRLLVGFAPGTDIDATATSAGVTELRLLGPGISLASVPDGLEATVAAALARSPNVAFAEPDYRRVFEDPVCTTCTIPNEQVFWLQWNMNNVGYVDFGFGLVYPTAKIDADVDWLEAFDLLGPSPTGAARIGILDTGIRPTHVDFACKSITWKDFYTPSNTTPFDDYGHGSHVAGIAGACADDGGGVVGIAYGPNMDFVVGKVCQVDGTCLSSAIVEALYWATDQGANVINMSFGDPQQSQAEATALAYAVQNGVLPVCAAGNEGTSTVLYPAADPNCVAVSATDYGDELASYSSYGPPVELSAPGGDVEDPLLGTSMITSTWNGWDTDWVATVGTSMAAPHVAGLAGLLFALGLTDASDVRACLASTSDDLGPAGRDSSFGFGRINVLRAVQNWQGCVGTGGGGGGTPNQPPTAAFTPSCSERSCTFDATASSDPDGAITTYAWTFGDGIGDTGATASHTYAADGTYTVTLVVTDDDGTGAQVSHDVDVATTPPPPPSGTDVLHVADLDGAVESGKGGRWHAVLTAAIADENGAPVSGALVSVFWDGATSGSGSFTTGVDGTGSIASGNARGDGTIGFAVLSVSLAGWTYDASANTDPDGDSNGTVIEIGTVSEPPPPPPPPPSGGITLEASGEKVKGVMHVDLSWSGASGAVDVLRNGSVIATAGGDTYADDIGKGSGTFEYQVCEGSVCSNTVTIVF